jgi:hypothetical protein
MSFYGYRRPGYGYGPFGYGPFGYGFGYGYGYGRPFLTPYTGAIISSDYRIGGLINEYAELNQVAARNNSIYVQNMIEDSCKCKSNNISYPPPYTSPVVMQSIIDSRYVNPFM